jgi:hypothetical protein
VIGCFNRLSRAQDELGKNSAYDGKRERKSYN